MILGLTGIIGSGKSTVLEIFSQLGWLTLSADKVCHNIYRSRDSEFYRLLVARWGERVISSDGVADTGVIAEIVFNDQVELEWLNRQLHPRIKKSFEEFIRCHRQRDMVLEIPLLFEAGWDDFCDTTLCVWTDWDITLERLRGRGLNRDQAERRVRQQWPADKKLACAAWGIINNGSEANLMKQCRYLDDILRRNRD